MIPTYLLDKSPSFKGRPELTCRSTHVCSVAAQIRHWFETVSVELTEEKLALVMLLLY